MWAICERVAEVQTLLDDHLAGGKHTAVDVIAKAQAILSEPALLRAMFDVGYFPPNTPPLGSTCGDFGGHSGDCGGGDTCGRGYSSCSLGEQEEFSITSAHLMGI